MNWRGYAILGAWWGTLFLVSCNQPQSEDSIMLPKNQWVCTDNHVASIKPYLTECVTYRKLK